MTKQLDFKLRENPPKINEWFVSLEGEGNAIGVPSIYVRLSYCGSAICNFCDTKKAWGEAAANVEIGDKDTTIAMAGELNKSQVQRMTITGGEPLHALSYFPDIYRWIDSISPTGINFLGIESNGNLLQSKEHCLELLSSFNEVIREHGVKPTLTISPKLDAETCYENQLTQDEVDQMYFTVFKNVSDYLQPYDVYYKFIYDYTEKIIDFDHQMIFINYLTDELNVPHQRIMVMPFTPEEPLGEDAVFWQESKDATARKALEIGVTYSPRIHIDRRLD